MLCACFSLNHLFYCVTGLHRSCSRVRSHAAHPSPRRPMKAGHDWFTGLPELSIYLDHIMRRSVENYVDTGNDMVREESRTDSANSHWVSDQAGGYSIWAFNRVYILTADIHRHSWLFNYYKIKIIDWCNKLGCSQKHSILYAHMHTSIHTYTII